MSGSASGKKSRTLRHFQRYELDTRIVVHIFREGLTSTIWGRSTTLAEEGVGATLTGDLEIGEVVALEFPLPLSPQALKLRAIVRYRNGYQYGLEFLAIDSLQRQALRRALDILPQAL